ncbi:MAG: DUF1648 domain-containing protein [Saprospiraceae bacterium]|nr:DUF1648 domain-containing protein [Saprospiraceae bacterium]
MTKRPKLQLKNTPWQNKMETISIIALTVLITYTSYSFFLLPDQIPTHLDIGEKANEWENKISLFILPCIGIAMYILLTFINKSPHLFNYAIKVTEKNAAHLYQTGRSLNTTLKTVILVFFTYIAWSSIQEAYGLNNTLNWLFLPLFLVAFAAVIIVHMRIMNQVKNDKLN